MHVILGATGRIGEATLAELLRRGETVRAVVRGSSRTDRLPGGDVGVAEFGDADALGEAMRGARTVQVTCPPSEHVDATIEAPAAAVERARPEAVLAISDYGGAPRPRYRHDPALPPPRGAAEPDAGTAHPGGLTGAEIRERLLNTSAVFWTARGSRDHGYARSARSR
ncbi:MAG TPA: NAD(P)H-binding protein [Candidatus Dormibacteraeota bacterium]|nr:NAD(P)H-binding protein [Candidatus Dormibacteraeota bacterium]